MVGDGVTNGGQLRRAREVRGLTQAQVAERLAALAWHRDHSHVGVTPDMVSKWERGEKLPSRRYRELLCLLHDAPPAELGFATDSACALVSRRTASHDVPWAEILFALGEPGQLLHRHLIELWESDLLKRRELLASMGLAVVASTLDALVPPVASSAALSPEPRTSPETLDRLNSLATSYQRLYHDTSPRLLMAPITAHLRTVEDLLKRGASERHRRQLLANHSKVAQLAGRLAFFDLRDPLAARGHLMTAYDSAVAAGDVALAAGAMGHLGFIPAAVGQWNAAADHLSHARTHAEAGAPAVVRSWLAAVASEIRTNEGDHHAALTAVDDAKRALASVSATVVPAWFDFYDATRLHGFEGYALLRDGDAAAAERQLDQALSALEPAAVKQRTVFLTDLASARVAQGDIDSACELAGDAATELATQPYGTCIARLRDFRSSLRPYRTSRAVRELDRAMVEL